MLCTHKEDRYCLERKQRDGRTPNCTQSDQPLEFEHFESYGARQNGNIRGVFAHKSRREGAQVSKMSSLWSNDKIISLLSRNNYLIIVTIHIF